MLAVGEGGLRDGGGQGLVRGQGGVHPQDGHQGLVAQLQPVGFPAQAGVLQPGALVVSGLQHQGPHLQDPLPVLHHPLAPLQPRPPHVLDGLPPVRHLFVLYHLLLLNTPPLLLFRDTTLISGSTTWKATVSTRTPTATWWRRWCSRTSVSPTQRKHAGLRIKNDVLQSRTRTAPVLSRPMLSEFASM